MKMARHMVTIGTPANLMRGRQYAQIKRDALEEKTKGGKSRLDPLDRSWRKKVITAAGNKCKECGSVVRLHAHHVIPISLSPKLRYEVKNGECLCYRCHAFKHPKITNFMLSAPACSRKDMAKIMQKKYKPKTYDCINPDDLFIEVM